MKSKIHVTKNRKLGKYQKGISLKMFENFITSSDMQVYLLKMTVYDEFIRCIHNSTDIWLVSRSITNTRQRIEGLTRNVEPSGSLILHNARVGQHPLLNFHMACISVDSETKIRTKSIKLNIFNNLTSDSLCRSCPGCFFANILITSGVLKASLIAAWIAWNNLCIHNRNICRPNKRVNPWQCLSIRQF